MSPRSLCTAGILALLCVTHLSAQTEKLPADFSVTLRRSGCLGTCPAYDVTILGNGVVHYEGRAYVRVKGVRSTTIPIADVEKLAKLLQDEHFFQWNENGGRINDAPEVRISATMAGLQHEVFTGTPDPKNVWALADNIDKVVRTERWVRRSWRPHL